jgi:transposase-like protein
LYFLVLTLRNTSKALEPFIDRSYVSIWYWVQEFNPNNVFPNKKSRIAAFGIDQTIIQIGGANAWLWVAVEPMHYRIILEFIFQGTGICLLPDCFKIID